MKKATDLLVGRSRTLKKQTTKLILRGRVSEEGNTSTQLPEVGSRFSEKGIFAKRGGGGLVQKFGVPRTKISSKERMDTGEKGHRRVYKDPSLMAREVEDNTHGKV